MTRLGFVGVGKHAQKMAAAFRECGAEVVAYDRVGSDAVSGFGRRMPWRMMLPDYGTRPQVWAGEQWTDLPNIDAVIICAPPEVTTEVALACAKAGKRCVATKPLIWTTPLQEGRWITFETPAQGERRLYVDLWRLYSPAWLELKAELRGKKIQSVHVDFYGNGPVRSFSGLLDYGPHALAFVADLLGECGGLSCGSNGPGLWEIFRRQESTRAGVVVTTGNGWSESKLAVHVGTAQGSVEWRERDGEHWYYALRHADEPTMRHDRDMALHAFCRAFLAVEPSDTLRLSCEAMKVLMPMVG